MGDIKKCLIQHNVGAEDVAEFRAYIGGAKGDPAAGLEAYISDLDRDIEDMRGQLKEQGFNVDIQEERSLNQFAGKGAANADMANLERAKQMLEGKRSMEMIRRETGWHLGVDGLWRYEITDDGAQIKKPFPEKGQMWGDIYRSVGKNQEDSVRVGQIFDHELLYAAYPDIAHIVVGTKEGSGATYYRTADVILVGEDVTMNEFKSILLHEIQHAIQEREGFALGGSADITFTESVQSALGNMASGKKTELFNWQYENKKKMEESKRAAQVARFGLMYESMKRLREYANRDKPSGVFRLIRNEMQWIYHANRDEGYETHPEKAAELQRMFYEIPTRGKQKGRARNEFLSRMAWDAAEWLESVIPPELKKQFDDDPRTMKGMLNALNREADKAYKALAPMWDMEKDQRAAQTAYEANKYKGAYGVYEALAGEIEARNTQARMGMTAEERRDTSPESTADVPAEEAIVIMGGMEILSPKVMNSESAPVDKRGSITLPPDITNGKILINIYEAANLSTFLHESGHFYLEVLKHLAEQRASKQIMDDWKAVQKWLGTKKGELTTEQHETWARGFEAYLMEGNAPSVELQSTFARFRAWLVSIYKTISKLNVQLNDDIRGVMDRLVATDEEIEAAQLQQNMAPKFLDPIQAGMTEKEYEEYVDAVNEASEEAETILARKFMHEFERENRKWWIDRRAEVRAEVEKEVYAQRVYAALRGIQQGILPDGSEMPEGERIKLDKAALVADFGKEFLKRLPRPYVYAVKGGLNHNQVAEMFGYTSGEEMVLEMANANNPKRLVEAETDQRMREQYGDMRLDGTAAVEAMHAVHNDGRAKLLELELKKLSSRTKKRVSPRQVVRRQAEETIARKSLKSINPFIYQRAEAKAARLARESLLAGDHDRAFKQTQLEQYNHEMYRAARNAKESAEKSVQYLRKFEQKSVRQKIGKVQGGYLEQIDSLLDAYEFRKLPLKRLQRRANLREWLEQNEEPHAIPQSVIEDSRQINYKELTPEFIQGVTDAVKNIEHLANVKNKLLLNKQRRDAAEVAAEMDDDLRENARKKKPTLTGRSTKEKVRKAGDQVLSVFLHPDTLIKEMAGGKDFSSLYRHIKEPIDRAVSEKLIPMQRKAAESIEQLFSVYSVSESKEMHSKKEFIPEFNDSLTKWELISMALNWGNQSSRDALLSSDNFKALEITEAEVVSALGRLDKRDWDFVQSVWDYVNSYWGEISALEKSRTGLTPAKVDGIPVETAHGTYAGGYYPLKYNGDLSIRVSEESIDDMAKSLRTGRFGRAQTQHGHTIERVGSGGRPVLLDISVFHSHINQVIYDLAMSEAVTYVDKVMKNHTVSKAFEETGYNEYYKALDIWLKDVATGEMKSGHWLEKGFRWLRTGTSIAALGWNVGTVAIQPLGYTQTIAVIGKEYAWHGFKEMMKKGSFEQVMDESPFMAERATTFNKDIMDTIQQMKGGVIPDPVMKSLFYMLVKAQQYVDMASWLGAYKKAMDGQADNIDAGDNRSATLYADNMVKRSQASGLFHDRSAFERGTFNDKVRQTEMVKMWTTLISFMLAKGNIFYQKTNETNFKDPAALTRIAIDIALLFVLESIAITAMRGGFPDEDDDETVAGKIAKETGKTAIAMIPFARDFASEAQGFRGGGVVGNFAKKLGDAYTQIDQGEFDKALIKSLNTLGGTVFHYPASQTNRFIDAYWRDYIDGEDVPLIEWLIWREK